MWRLALLVLVGCGRIEFDRLGDGGTVIGPDGILVTCPASYVRTPRGGCYRVDETPSTWLQAEAKCESEGGHLAIIASAQDLSDVAGVLPSDIADAFVGGTDRITEGNYLTVDGKPAYIEWSAGEPDGQDVSDCLEIRDDGLMGDTDCGGLEDFVCAIDGVAVDPASF